MNGNWVSAFDMLASSGVIDFDAPAFILDQPPRYVGHPRLETLPNFNPAYKPHGVKLKDIPTSDNFDPKNKDIAKNPRWKKALFAGVTIGTALGIAINIAAGKIKSPKRLLVHARKTGRQVIKWVKAPFKWIANKIK